MDEVMKHLHAYIMARAAARSAPTYELRCDADLMGDNALDNFSIDLDQVCEQLHVGPNPAQASVDLL